MNNAMKQRYICEKCSYIYDPKKGDPTQDISPDTPFKDLPNSWLCPVCKLGLEFFFRYNY